ncbi:uncharacterized protein A1O9_02733 [Exophiala aquamarina CBS 119918]|uniref:Cytochrome P450 oxidoreductase n=1 Tax=Exophiala aquamarina CBS 119918 TaxID=1182545 RepID=A0A072PP98_9EURO|nr:uncharacterized protein A1O9_02733 [Exophiala aquamarina CBS 119918]KEF61168.1 hypothetical protein A1O9_02733 [Exophiala aquamarina CBS 119918]
MRDKVQHSKRRKLLSHAFSQSNLYECEPLIHKQIEKLITVLQSRIGKPTDMLNWFRLTAFDVVGELFLGQSFGGLESGETPQFLSDIELFFILADIQWNYPWLAIALSWVPLKSVQYFLGAMQRLADYGAKAFNSYVGLYGRESGRKDLLTKILSVKAETGESQLGDRETSIEIGNLVFAGTVDTTSTTLTFLFWELAKHQAWQAKLRTEVRAHCGNSPTFQEVQDLPILEAVIDEALRLHPAAPASLPRETPTGGRELNGFFIPEKTIASMQCYTTHRDPVAFPDPEAFKPERWMEGNDVTTEMKELFMPFSKGSRACIGKNLAMMELKLITARLIKQFKCTVAPVTTEDSMATMDHFLLIPVGGKCELIFEVA